MIQGNETASSLLADVIADAVRAKVGAVGVLVRDVPAPEPNRLLERLHQMQEAEGIDLRIAYIQPGGRAAADRLGLASDVFTDEIEQAELWRNDRGLDALIVVVAHGDEAKLSSLEDFTAITSRELKGMLIQRALGDEQGGQNEVQSRWWRLLSDDDAIGLGQVIDYYLALQDKTGGDFLDASSRQIFRLGLLPDPQLFDSPKEQSVKQRLQLNRDLVTRLQTLTPKDRRTIARALDAEADPVEKQALQNALGQMERMRWEGDGLEAISLQAASRLVKARKQGESVDTPPRPTAQRADAVASEALTDPERAGDVATIVEGLQEQLQELDDFAVLGRKRSGFPSKTCLPRRSSMPASIS